MLQLVRGASVVLRVEWRKKGSVCASGVSVACGVGLPPDVGVVPLVGVVCGVGQAGGRRIGRETI